MAAEPIGRGSVSVVIVTYNSGEAVTERLAALQHELEPGDEIVVVDNGSADGTAGHIARSGLPVKLVRNVINTGFAAASNLGAAHAAGDLLLFLNPDVVAEPGAITALRSARGWDVWQGLVVMPDGQTVNTAGGELHYLGMAWAGGCGEPVDQVAAPREVAFASGACLMLERASWEMLGGFAETFFMYCEDVDLSLRARLRGQRVGVEPSARFRHEYEFDKGQHKWRLLERNRWFVLIRVYPRRLLIAVLPGLLLAEIGITAAAAAGGWLRSKLRAQREVLVVLPRLLRERREIARSADPSADLAGHMSSVLDSPNVPSLARSSPVALMLRMYWRLVQRAVRA